MSSEKSRVIAARLHPDDPREGEALEIVAELNERGFSNREIITDAILNSKGRTPEMYRNADDKVTLGILENVLAEFAEHIISQLRNSGMIIQPDEPKERRPFEEDEDRQTAENLAAGFLNRRNRK